MKTRQLLIAVFLASACLLRAATNDMTALLQRGLFEEEANHNLEAAMQAYQTAIAEHDKDRKLVATAVFRLGECLRKQGKIHEADLQYQRVLAEFADQEALVKASASNLGDRAQKGLAAAPSPKIVAPQPMPVTTSEEDEEIRKIQVLIKNSPDLINSHIAEGILPLQQAASKGYLRVAEFLLANGAEVNGQAGGVTPLWHAVKNGHKAMVELLLAKGANPDLNNVLSRAVESGFKSVVEVLLANKANVNAQDGDRNRPLHFAITKHNLAIATKLIDSGAEINAKGANGRTPLVVAVFEGQFDIAQLLLAHKADVNIADDQQTTPLHSAASYGNVEFAKALLANGANIEANSSQSTDRGPTPLTWAIYESRPEMVEFLLQNHADPNIKFTWQNQSAQQGITPLIMAIKCCSKEPAIVESLLAHGANPNTKSEQSQEYPVFFAITEKNYDALQSLLRHKVDLGVVKKGHTDTPLVVACCNHDYRAVELLLDAGADINAGETVGFTPLHAAVFNCDIKMVNLLISRKADVNALNSDGKPPLGFAVPHNNETPEQIEELKQILIKAGADVNYIRARQIAIKQMGSSETPIFFKDTKNYNRHTLGELIARKFIAQWGGDDFPFPDFSNITIRRLQPDGAIKTITVNATLLLQTGDPSEDFALEWGDIVVIPTLDHNVGERWTHLPKAQMDMLAQCLSRKVDVIVKGQKTTVLLAPTVSSGFEGWSFRQTHTNNLVVFGFRLRDLLDPDNGLLRVSSDVTRIKVTRPAANGAPQEMIINESKGRENVNTSGRIGLVRDGRGFIGGSNGSENGNTDLWLRDGDVIEIPDRDPNAPDSVPTSVQAFPPPGGGILPNPPPVPSPIPSSAPTSSPAGRITPRPMLVPNPPPPVRAIPSGPE